MSLDPEGTPGAPGNSPAPEAPAAPATDVNWEQRFKDTQAAYTQSQQELAELRRLADGEDPDALKAVLDKYGYQLDEPEEEPAPPEGAAPAADPRIEEIAQWKAQQEQAQQQATINAEWAGWAEFVKDKAKTDHGVELTPREIKAFQLDSVGKDGLPLAPAEAEQVLKDYLTEREAWVESLRKPRPRAPHIPTGGQAATGGKDPADMTRQELDRWMTDRLNAGSA